MVLVHDALRVRPKATHDEAYRRYFARSDEVFGQCIAEIIEDGIERGFRECDPEAAVEMLLTVSFGVTFLRSMEEVVALENVREELEFYRKERCTRSNLGCSSDCDATVRNS